jgi:hypothetical protein
MAKCATASVRAHTASRSLTGSSVHLAVTLLPDPERPEDAEADSFLDVSALGSLQQKVNANRITARYEPIPEYDYRFTNRNSLEFMAQLFPELLNLSEYTYISNSNY